MKISTKLAVGFSVLLVLMMTMTGIGFWRLGDMAQRVHKIISDDAKEERVIWDWFSETKSNAVRAIVLTRTDDEDIKKLLAPRLEATTKRISELQKQVEALLSTNEAKAIFAEVGEKRKAYIAARTAAVDARKAGNKDEANRLVDTRMVPAIEEYIATLQKMVEYQKSALESSGDVVVSNAQLGRTIYVVSAMTILVFGLALMWWLRRSIMEPLAGAVRVAQTVADGDLTAVIETGSNDEAGQLMRALDQMNKNLAIIVLEVRNATEGIEVASREIAASNSNLSSRTEQQASSLEETAASIEELTGTVKGNADMARQAATFAAGASSIARKGGEMVKEVVQTMAGISESSGRIADIIGVIDGIAFQTNILALNAAVEAARAGEQGRGFAVVASEVRSLAQRSADAAKEIKALISDSAGNVENGARIVDDTGKTMQEIVDSVHRVNNIITQISASSQEQSAGIEQVSQAITHMDDATQQNAALVEQAAATAEQLASQAELLSTLVARFKVSDRRTIAREQSIVEAKEDPSLKSRSAGTAASSAMATTALPKTQAPRLHAPGPNSGGDGQWKEF